ncbi:WG repeat-containing protein [Flavobacterium sp. W22_SRS_FP1]|uniref:WG repeat-containing protein n=1 Tax=Flavobacterium sp. W22_SRS_FP1 TaxID=3240276 RepID=UPI003F92D6A1
MSYCINCGTQQGETAKFCHSCGKNQEEIKISNLVAITLDKSSPNLLLTASVKTEEGDLRYGKINIKGDWVIQPIFDFLDDEVDFEEGDLIRVELNQKWGLIDQMGHWVIQPNYNQINEYFDLNSYFKAQSLNYGYGFLNKRGEWAVQPVFDLIGVFDYDLKVYPACVNNKWGTIDLDGNWVIQPVFDFNFFYFNADGISTAAIKNKMGYINKLGNWIIDPIYDSTENFDEQGFGLVGLKDKMGFINSKAEWIIPPIFDELGSFDNQDYSRAKTDGNFGFIDRNGNWIIQPNFIDVDLFDNQGYCRVEINTKVGLIDRNGNFLIQPMFDSLASNDDQEMYRAVLNERAGFINCNGEWLISPIYKDEFYGDLLYNFDKNNLAKVRINGKFGLINTKGELVFKIEHHLLEVVKEGLYKISTNNKYGYADENCNWIIAPQFDYFKESPLNYEDMIWNDEIKDWEEENDEEDEDEDYPKYDFESYFSNVIGKEKIYLEDNIPEKKIKAFLKNYNSDFVDNSEICVYYDDTLWGKGDDGFAILQNNDGLLYLFINEYGRTAVHYCLGNDEVNLAINKIEYSDKKGLTIHSINPKTLEKYDHNISSFTKKDVTEALYNFLIENTVLFDEDDEDDEDNEDYEDAIEDDDPLGIRVNTTSTDQNDPLGLRN